MLYVQAASEKAFDGRFAVPERNTAAMTFAPSTWGRRLTILTFLAAFYFLAAKFGLLLAWVHPNASPIWPCTAMALAAVLLIGYWVWPAIFAGALLANLFTPTPFLPSFAIAVGNTLEALAGGWLVNRFACGLRAFESPQCIVAFAGMTAFLSTTLSATIGVAALCASGLAMWAEFTPIWLTWWGGNAMSDLVLAPFLLLWFTNHRIRWSVPQLYEAALLVALLCYIGQCVFGGWLPLDNKNLPLTFICFPFLLWAAMRFGQREAATATLLLSAIAIAGTMRGYGPFATTGEMESLLLLQAFLNVGSIMSLVIAAVVGERRRVEVALRESEAWTRAILDTTVDAIITIGEDGVVLSFNPAAERIFGYKAPEVIGRNVSQLMPAPDSERHDQYIRNYLRTGHAKIIGIGREVKGLRKDGTLFDMDLAISEVWVSGRHIFTGIVRDITERQRAGAALRQSEERFRSLSESAPIGIFQSDIDGRIIYTNTTWQAMTALGEREMLGSGWLKAVHPADRAVVATEWQRYVTEGRTFSLEFRLLRPNGEVRWVHARASALGREGGAITGYVGTIEDISERKRDEHKLRELAAELARSNKDLEHFAYVASHDLQEPLRKVRSFTELLADRYKGRMDPTADEFIAYIVDGARRMQELISNLLAYSRVGLGDMVFADVDMSSVAADALRDLDRMVVETGAKIDCAPLPTVRGNPTLLRQLMLNLLGNAVKFRREDPPRVKVEAREDNGNWLFTVTDNGIGIAREHQQRVFLLFQRLHTRQDYPGTGIGLAMCKKIVERHGGRIWIESAVGTGTTFHFTLPRGTAAPSGVESAARLESAETPRS
jgi:PAS domain S-box-containing protein